MKHFAVVLFLIVCAASTTGREKINFDGLRKTVVFLYLSDANGDAISDRPLGTGFLVGVPIKGKTEHYAFLVTARHMVDPNWAGCSGPEPTRLSLRYNKKNYDPTKDSTGVDFARLPLISDDGKTNYWYHPSDDNADVAVVALQGHILDENLDELILPVSSFATDKELRDRSSSDPVISLGLLPAFTGSKRNYPIAKFGHISTIPDEMVAVPCQTPAVRSLHLWFLAINLVPGNSGSAIFYIPEDSNNVSSGGGRAVLLGLQSTSFPGADVSGMTPVNYIHDAIKNAIKEKGLRDADLTD
jgi:hypothetical protein